MKKSVLWKKAYKKRFWVVFLVPQLQYSEGYVNVEIGDIVNIDGMIGPLYDIRFIQTLRDPDYQNWVQLLFLLPLKHYIY